MAGLPSIEVLRLAWYGPEGALSKTIDAAFDRIGFTQAYVDSLVAGINANDPSGVKVIKDNIWGMVEVDPGTVVMLDTPLLQRLRRIRQLGFSYLVYPSAEHSRFCHSIGVYYVIRRFLESIRRAEQHDATLESGLYNAAPPSDAEQLDLCHAALLHDVGHLPYSHVTEKVLESDATDYRVGSVTVDDFTFEPEDKLHKRLSLSEVISLAIVLSPRFQRFYGALRHDQSAYLRVASLIAGFRSTASNRALPDLLSSGLDADKVDYLCRDADACRIPLGVDVARVFLRSRFLRVAPGRIPEALKHQDDPAQELTVFVVNASGIDTIEEMTFARAAMYHRVYFHHTTRCAERILGQAIWAAREQPVLGDAIGLWTCDDGSLLDALQRSDVGDADSGAAALQWRRLPKRSIAFGPQLVSPIVGLRAILKNIQPDHAHSLAKQVSGEIIERLKAASLSGPHLRTLEDKIREEAVNLRDQLSHLGHEVPSGVPERLCVLPIPNLGHTKAPDVFVLERDGHLSSSREYLTSTELMDAAELHRALGYVYVDAPWREIVFVAARTVLDGWLSGTMSLGRLELRVESAVPAPLEVGFRPRFRLHLERTARRSKLDPQRLELIIRLLQDRGDYFETRPALAWPTAINTQLVETAMPLRAFNGQHGWQVTNESVAAYIDQFPPRLRDAAADLIRRIRLLDRSLLATSLTKALNEILLNAPSRRFLAPLSPNSGNVVRTLFEQEAQTFLSEQGWLSRKSLNEVLGEAKDDDLVVLVDDNLSSGSQAEAQLRAWNGQPREQWPELLRSERGIEDAPLEANKLHLLGKVRLAVAVCAGTERGKSHLKDVAQVLGLAGFEGVFYGTDLQPGAQPAELAPELLQFLADVGQSVLEYCRWGHEHPGRSAPESVKESCRRDALGYDNQRGLLATLFTVPTSTITALWCPGLFRGEPWVPLLLRRGYIGRLVLA